MMQEQLVKFVDPRFVVALIVILYFGWAFAHNPGDATLIGALISSFNIGVGYYLGSARSADEANKSNRAAVEAMVAANNQGGQ